MRNNTYSDVIERVFHFNIVNYGDLGPVLQAYYIIFSERVNQCECFNSLTSQVSEGRGRGALVGW